MSKYEGLDRFVSLLFPKGCVLCGKAVDYDNLICQSCVPERPLDIKAICPRCAKEQESCVCAPRESGQWAFEGAVSALLYQGKTRQAILRLKETPDRRIKSFFAQEMARTFRELYPDFYFDFITEVPMHPQRLEKRGFNQAELLAAEVSPLLKIPHRMRVLACTNEIGQQQHNLTLEERFAAAMNRYILQIRTVADKHILLIDDVLTTGATADACAKQLLSGGAANVFVLTAARTARKN